jgi:hypothetical protein
MKYSKKGQILFGEFFGPAGAGRFVQAWILVCFPAALSGKSHF